VDVVVYIRAQEGKKPANREGWPKCYHLDKNCRVLKTARANAVYSTDESQVSLESLLKSEEEPKWKPCSICCPDSEDAT
jgi:hypothetical protein